MKRLEQLAIRAENLLSRFEKLLASKQIILPDWSAPAFRWQRGMLLPVWHIQPLTLDDLQDIGQQKQRVEQNTRQFVQGRSANNVLLTGARGTGKSSLVKALLNQFSAQGLRLIEIDKAGLSDLPDIIELVGGRAERFILYCDDLSFNDDEPGYQALKAALDGSIVALPENLIIYATSNRRHLMPEYMQENLATQHGGGEVHPAEGIEEKISLSERFGLWISFYPFNQDEYLAIAQHWVTQLSSLPFTEEARRAVLQWALMRGSRSGRVANQFAKDWCGQHENR